MNRIEKLHEMSAKDITEAVIKISALSNWKCRLCNFKDDCNKNCFLGIMTYFTLVDISGKEEEK